MTERDTDSFDSQRSSYDPHILGLHAHNLTSVVSTVFKLIWTSGPHKIHTKSACLQEPSNTGKRAAPASALLPTPPEKRLQTEGSTSPSLLDELTESPLPTTPPLVAPPLPIKPTPITVFTPTGDDPIPLQPHRLLLEDPPTLTTSISTHSPATLQSTDHKIRSGKMFKSIFASRQQQSLTDHIAHIDPYWQQILSAINRETFKKLANSTSDEPALALKPSTYLHLYAIAIQNWLDSNASRLSPTTGNLLDTPGKLFELSLQLITQELTETGYPSCTNLSDEMEIANRPDTIGIVELALTAAMEPDNTPFDHNPEYCIKTFQAISISNKKRKTPPVHDHPRQSSAPTPILNLDNLDTVFELTDARRESVIPPSDKRSNKQTPQHTKDPLDDATLPLDELNRLTALAGITPSALAAQLQIPKLLDIANGWKGKRLRCPCPFDLPCNCAPTCTTPDCATLIDPSTHSLRTGGKLTGFYTHKQPAHASAPKPVGTVYFRYA